MYDLSKNQRPWVIALTIISMVVVFVIDINVELGVALGVVYVGVVWLGYFSGSRNFVLVAAGVCTALTLWGFTASPAGGEEWKVLINRQLAVAGIWVTGILCWRNLGMYQRLQERQEFLQSVIDTTPNGIVMVDAEGEILFVNQGLCGMFGYSKEELIGQKVELLMPIRFREGHERHRHIFNHQPKPRKMGEGGELTGRKKDGSEFPLETQLTPAKIDSGFCVLASIEDISGRKRLEETERVLMELRRTNKALDEFAYVASHDLRTPLDGIKTLAEWIEEDNAHTLPDESKGHLKQMQGRIDRMNRLLNDLLDYSRAGRRHGDVVMVDTSQLLNKITEFIAPPVGFLIQIQDNFPKFQTARTPLEQVFRNLISNSIKHHDRLRGTIEVSFKELEDFYEFSVSDDGPGIPSEFHAQIFEMFETLEARDEIEGSGMGLALIKKIVENYGGSISVDSPNGRGATFRFTWPKLVDIQAVQQR